MFSIRQSHADCSSCKLLESPSAIADTNSHSDLSMVDIMFVAENPGKLEIIGGMCEGEKFPAGTPLIGRSGKVFRKCFNEFVKPTKVKYYITNSVLCSTIRQGITVNPTENDVEKCRPNLDNIINICKPKLIVTMGRLALKSFGIDSRITAVRGKIVTVNGIDLLPTFHPSYVNRTGGIDGEIGKLFRNDIVLSIETLGYKIDKKNLELDTVTYTEGYGCYSLPNKYYTDEYKLVDIQSVNRDNKLIYIFRDSNNNREFYVEEHDANYYWYDPKDSVEAKLVESIDNVVCSNSSYSMRSLGGDHYESDIRPAEKRALDYYLNSTGEPSLEKENILFFDIELYNYKKRTYSEISEAKSPISAITFAKDDGKIYIYLLHINNEIDTEIYNLKKDEEFFNNQNSELKIFTDEREMLKAFFRKIDKMEVSFLCGWNSNMFDIPYIYNRVKTLKIRSSFMSPFKNVYVTDKTMHCDITGFVCLDLLVLYKKYTYSGEPSYSLNNIANKVLNRGKREYDGDLDDLYSSDIKTFLEYAIIDVNLLQDMEDILGHVSLHNELRIASTTTFESGSRTTGLADGLFNYELKTSGFVMRNMIPPTDKNIEKKIIGGFVKIPEGGIYDWVVDFDYTSLYPSIICSLNLGPNTYIGKISEQDAGKFIYSRKKFLSQNNVEIRYNPLYNELPEKITCDTFVKFLSDNNATISDSGCIFIGHDKEKSIFYNIIKKLFDKRKKYKKLMFESEERGDDESVRHYNNKQMAYKILLNSLYGVLAQGYFRFFNLELAECITISGRKLITFAGDHIDTYMKNVVDKNNTEIVLNPDFFKSCEGARTYLRYCDTDSLFIWMKPYFESCNLEITPDKVEEEAHKLQAILNNDILNIYTRLHNIQSAESMLELKNELVCKRYYCIDAKKKYALHIVRNEGVAVDKIEPKGLEIRRSDYSELTKEILKTILDMIFKNEVVSAPKIFEYAEQMKLKAKKIITDRDIAIYKTVSFSKPLSEYKAMPQHIKGILIYNILEHDMFRYGARGILVPLKGIDMMNLPDHVYKNINGKFLDKFNMSDLDVIVLPEETLKVPDYYHIDVDRVLDFAINKRVDLLLKPLAEKADLFLTWDM